MPHTVLTLLLENIAYGEYKLIKCVHIRFARNLHLLGNNILMGLIFSFQTALSIFFQEAAIPSCHPQPNHFGQVRDYNSTCSEQNPFAFRLGNTFCHARVSQDPISVSSAAAPEEAMQAKPYK